MTDKPTNPNITRDLTNHWSRAFALMAQHPYDTDYGPHETEVLCKCLHELYAEHNQAMTRLSNLEANARAHSGLLAAERFHVASLEAHTEAVEAERDRLAARVAELETAAAPVEWREGVPSIEDVRAHEEFGGLWEYTGDDRVCPAEQELRVRAGVLQWDALGVWVDSSSLDRSLRWRPVVNRRTPAPWPVHDQDTATAPDGGDCGGSDVTD
jgi:hypothetical protein